MKNGNIHPTRIFKTPQELEFAWEKYVEHLKEEALNWTKIQYVGKDGAKKEDAYKIPYTQEGFEIFCYRNYGCVEQYFKNPSGYYDDFIPICSYIKKEIRANQIVGGLLGIYNPSITQRINALVDKTEDVSVQPKKLTIKINRSEED